MHFQHIAYAAVLSTLTNAKSLSGFQRVARSDVLPLPESPPTWTGPVFEGGDDVALKGTVESVVAQLRAINPDWNEDIQRVESAARNVEMRPSRTESAKREEISPPSCNPGGQTPAETRVLSNGADYLKGLGNRLLTQGPRSCGRISCSYNAGIVLCNDSSYPITTTAYEAGERVAGIVGLCGLGGEAKYTSGQVFDTDGWNIIAARNNC